MDSGATCHMCNDESIFTEMKKLGSSEKKLGSSEKVTLGDGRPLEVAGEGTVDMEMLLTDGNSRGCALQKVLYIPELAYNLVSVLKATEAGKTVKFYNTSCEFVNSSDEIVAFATKQGTSIAWNSSGSHMRVPMQFKRKAKSTCGTAGLGI